MENNIKAGSIVRIRRGAHITSTRRKETISKREYLITVDRIDRGIMVTRQMIYYEDFYLNLFLDNGGDWADALVMKTLDPKRFREERISVSPARVVWAGTGGYWKYTEMKNVILVKP